jgi:hypothetical protein
MECFQCVGYTKSFLLGALSYAGVQAGGIGFSIRMLKYVVPSNVHMTISLIWMLLKLFAGMVAAKLKSYFSKLFPASTSTPNFVGTRTPSQTSLSGDQDVPVKTMRKPRSLTSSIPESSYSNYSSLISEKADIPVSSVPTYTFTVPDTNYTFEEK